MRLRRQRPKPPNRPRRALGGESDPPSLIELERFSQQSLHKWREASHGIDALHRLLFFDLESLRQRDGQKLLDAIRAGARTDFEFHDWSRIVDYRYSLAPLSTAGSVKDIGGRFNFGAALSPGSFSPFPALYLADGYATAFREKYGLDPTTSLDGLTAIDLALRTPSSFTQVRVRGRIDLVIDVEDTAALQPAADVIKRFSMPKTAVTLARRLQLKSPMLVRSSKGLQRHLLHPNWRATPAQFGIPSNSQIFGRLVAGAGIHGIVYPSSRKVAGRCLALFTQNWTDSRSFIEIVDTPPVGATRTRIKGSTKTIQ
jgi:RES domain-containing protein